MPISFLASVVVQMSSPGPVMFRQKRALCYGGTEFRIHKLRTMRPDAEVHRSRLLSRNETDGALFKMENDPRVVPGANLIRRLSLDEVPQFIDVLKGDMSVVGPRPLPVIDLQRLSADHGETGWERLRDAVVPGITGLWQVSGRSELSFVQMLLLDIQYVRHRSLALDFEIVFATIPAVLSGRGST
jgi:lipopolysaccharide/colanic/teichoic acid biosynthesis glycosyltransferase